MALLGLKQLNLVDLSGMCAVSLPRASFYDITWVNSEVFEYVYKLIQTYFSFYNLVDLSANSITKIPAGLEKLEATELILNQNQVRRYETMNEL